MEDWLMMDTEESSDNSDEEKEGKEYFMIFKAMERLGDPLNFLKRKKKKDEEQEVEQYYNVSVYRMLPYPPHTKDEKDFFIQKTSCRVDEEISFLRGCRAFFWGVSFQWRDYF
jgi:hypothetical protein